MDELIIFKCINNYFISLIKTHVALTIVCLAEKVVYLKITVNKGALMLRINKLFT